MIGFSIDLIDEVEVSLAYIRKMASVGFTSVFTTIYEPDEEKTDFLKNLKLVGEECSKLGMNLTLGTSSSSLKEVNLRLRQSDLEIYGITGIRLTKSTSNQLIAELSQNYTVCIPASHKSEKDVTELQELGAKMNNIEAWFFYYEREEIGISRDYMIDKNRYWQSMGIKTCAFIPGDDDYTDDFVSRVSLETHRHMHPLYCTIDLLKNIGLDKACIGDSPINDKTMYQFYKYMKENTILFFADVLDYEYFPLIEGRHRNRIDEGEFVIRAEDLIIDPELKIVDRYIITRPRGSMTIDNNLSGRFEGEFHIGKVDFPLSREVNVVAYTRESDRDLLDVCRGGDEFLIMENLPDEEIIQKIEDKIHHRF